MSQRPIAEHDILTRMNTYEQVVNTMLNLIENGVYKQGEKLPSLRNLSTQLHVSVNTIREAYWRMEDRNIIEAIPQSGYYVRAPWKPAAGNARPDPCAIDPKEESLCRIYGTLQETTQCPAGLCLGIATTPRGSWPLDRLRKGFAETLKVHPDAAFDYQMPPGYLPLREQIARLSLASKACLKSDDIVVTNGCHEAMFLSLMAVCKPGSTIAVESPIYFNIISLLERMDYNIIEIPSSDSGGINVDILEYLLETTRIQAVIAIPNFSNPTGACLDTNRKKRLVELITKHGVPLIEDDIYGDLGFEERPESCKSLDTEGLVIHCSSFTKTIAPGLRLGWVSAGSFKDDVIRLKTLLNLGAPPLTQMVLAGFLAEGGYERHLRALRKDLRASLMKTREALLENMPQGTAVSDPKGGFVLWVTLPEGYLSMDLYYHALKRTILIAPGSLFTRNEKYQRSFRINGAHWCPETLDAIRMLGKLSESSSAKTQQ